MTVPSEDRTIKLLDYRARYYDPALGRFIGPDTIVPDPVNPQSLNRFAYVYNNPLLYTDPSGHCPDGDTECEYQNCVDAGNDPEVCAVQTGGGEPGSVWIEYDPFPTRLLLLGLSARYEDMHFRIGNTTVYYGGWVQDADRWVWDNIPSGAGAYLQGTATVDYFLGGYVSETGGWVGNWRSGELSLFLFETGAGGRVGTPGFLSGDVSGGPLLLFGYSSNDALEGWSFEIGAGAQADAVGKLGVEVASSYEFEWLSVNPSGEGLVNNIPWPAFDSVVGKIPHAESIGVTLGANAFPSAVDASVQAGVSYTPVVWTARVPWHVR